MNLKLITPPASEPVTLSDVEGQVRLIDLSAEANTVELMISAVREHAEQITRRALITQTWELTLNSFPSAFGIYLPLPPLQTVDFIKYIDTNGIEQTLDPVTYRVLNKGEPGYVTPAHGITWPTVLDDVEVVTVRFTCGYGPISEDTADNVPKAIKQWCLINVANLFENRESIVVGNGRDSVLDMTTTLADGLLESYRIHRL